MDKQTATGERTYALDELVGEVLEPRHLFIKPPGLRGVPGYFISVCGLLTYSTGVPFTGPNDSHCQACLKDYRP